jgi:hypothetical protein
VQPGDDMQDAAMQVGQGHTAVAGLRLWHHGVI